MIKARATLRDAFQVEKGTVLTIAAQPIDGDLLDQLRDKDLDVRIEIHREKRSLRANAYFWELCTEIANRLRKSKEEIYINLLRDYGQSEIVYIKSEVNPRKYFKYFEVLGKHKDFTEYRIYQGSSEYNTEEMSILIDGAVQEAKALGIQVLSDSDLALLKEEWT